MHEMRSEDYAVEDDALPLLNLHPVTEVGIDIEKASVKLFIHPKQYKWPRDCSEACTVKTEFSVPGVDRDKTICSFVPVCVEK